MYTSRDSLCSHKHIHGCHIYTQILTTTQAILHPALSLKIYILVLSTAVLVAVAFVCLFVLMATAYFFLWMLLRILTPILMGPNLLLLQMILQCDSSVSFCTCVIISKLNS